MSDQEIKESEECKTNNTSRLLTVDQFSQEYPAFSQGSLRFLIFEAKKNGFDHVLVRIGRRVLLDETRFQEWVDKKRG